MLFRRYNFSFSVRPFPNIVCERDNETNRCLAIVRLAEPIALTSIYPYAWALVKKFHIGNAEDASFYSGLLISSFALCEAAMGM